MVTLRVAGSGSWCMENGWPWLRIRTEESKDRLLLEKCLRSTSGWKKHISVDLQGREDGVISFELWTGESRSTDFLHFVMGWTVDLAEWIQSGAANRWYEIGHIKTRGRGGASNGEYCGNTAELQTEVAYVLVGIVGVENPAVELSLTKEGHTHKSTFRFVLPHRSYARSGKLRAIRVGQIVRELRTDVLQDLLPLTLYGESSAKRRQQYRLKRPIEWAGECTGSSTPGLMKALVLLQLSCQYANYCVNELDRYSDKLDRRSIKLNNKIHRMECHQNLLKEQRANLRREDEVLACSLDGMQALLLELDPETQARLQEDENLDLQPTSPKIL